jgi:diacylglycerol kinase (ATP)
MADVHVLGNPTAGGGRAEPAIAEVVGAMRSRGHEVTLLRAAAREDVVDVVDAAVESGATRVVIVGGDGLAHLVTQAVAGRGVTLGLVPVGTGNDLARGLGLPLDDVAAAVDRALAAPVAIDALRTSHGWVASVASIGFSAAVNARANRLRWPRGSARYTLATLLELPSLSPCRVRIEVDGTAHEDAVSLLAIANTSFFGGGMAICPQATPTDGQVDLAVVAAVGRATLLRFFPRVFSGRHVTHPAVTMLRGAKVRIEALGEDRHGLWGDGEPVGALPVDIEVVRGALSVAGASTGAAAP